MAPSSRNVRGIKSRLRSSTSILSPHKPLPVYRIRGSKKVYFPPNGEKEDNFPLLETSIDLDYMAFLSNLKLDGKSYLLELRMGNPQRPVRLKYEEEEEEEEEEEGHDEVKCFVRKKRLKLDGKNLSLSKQERVDENKNYVLDNVNEIIMEEEEGEKEVRREEEFEDLLMESSSSTSSTHCSASVCKFLLTMWIYS